MTLRGFGGRSGVGVGSFAVALLAALALAPAAQAATPVACSELQTAITAATAGEVLELPAGTCETNVTTSNAEPFTLEGSETGTTTLKAKEATKAVLEANGTGALSFTLTHLTFTGTTSHSAVSVLDANEHVTISNDKFITNHSGVGGALTIGPPSASSSSESTVLSNDTFGEVGAGNSAEEGGAVYFVSSAPLVVRASKFIGDSAGRGGYGGALLVQNTNGGTSPVTLEENTFGGLVPSEKNTAGAAGGAAFVQLSHGQTLTLERNTFLGNAIAGTNTATQPRVGGALAVELRGLSDTGFHVVQREDTFFGNTIEATDESAAQPAGGAGEWVFGVTVESTYEIFEDNRINVNEAASTYAPEGGGLGVLGEKEEGVVPAQPGVFTGVSDIFASNFVKSGGRGGAIYSGFTAPYCYTSCPGSSVTLNDSTILNNEVEAGTGSEGGALWGSGTDTLAIDNSIVYNNSAAQVVGFGGAATFAFSDVCNEAGGTTIAGAGIICANPLLNEEDEETAASPTIDAGSNSLVPAGLTTGFIGEPRITAGRCGDAAVVDMGAFESPAATGCPPPRSTSTTHTTTTTTSTPATPQGTAGVTSMRTGQNGTEVTIACTGTAAQVCEGEGAMYTTEHLKGKKVASLSRKRKRVRKVTVLVGSAHYKLSAGRTLKLKIPLNAKGKALLRRFHRLPVRVIVTAITSRGKVQISSRRTTIKQASRHKRRRRRK